MNSISLTKLEKKLVEVNVSWPKHPDHIIQKESKERNKQAIQMWGGFKGGKITSTFLLSKAWSQNLFPTMVDAQISKLLFLLLFVQITHSNKMMWQWYLK